MPELPPARRPINSMSIAPRSTHPRPAPSPPRPLSLDLSPRDALARWPALTPLAAIWAGGAHAASRARETILARPRETIVTPHAGPFAFPPFLSRAQPSAPSPNSTPPRAITNPPRFSAGWIGWISYDAGRHLEPHAQHTPATAAARADRDWPLMVWARCDDALVFDHASHAWFAVGQCDDLLLALQHPPTSAPPPSIAPLRSATGRHTFVRGVERVLEYLRAGDAYQVNLAHRLSADFTGPARRLLPSLFDAADPFHGAYVEATLAGRRWCLASASPELFLSFDARTRRVESRPMKGTANAPNPSPAATHPAPILANPKDLAELDMIVDLMRNDLSRACVLGSVRVESRRDIERHAGSRGPLALFQGVATVAATLRRDASLASLLAGAFPAGSITGAPKIRAMQIIDELEPVRRGPYCGTLACVSDSGDALFNVAIRTLALSGNAAPHSPDHLVGTLDYSVGAGIVADSDPHAEWDETLHKAGLLERVLGPRCLQPVATRAE